MNEYTAIAALCVVAVGFISFVCVVAARLYRRAVNGPNSTARVGESVVVSKNGTPVTPTNRLATLIGKILPC